VKYLLVLLLSGCASFAGVQMDDKERAACAVEGCSVWTDKELEGMARQFFNWGYEEGKKSI